MGRKQACSGLPGDNLATRLCATYRALTEGALWLPNRHELLKNGAGNRSRTYDLRITNALLYQLSYSGNIQVAAVLNRYWARSIKNARAAGNPESVIGSPLDRNRPAGLCFLAIPDPDHQVDFCNLGAIWRRRQVMHKDRVDIGDRTAVQVIKMGMVFGIRVV